MRLLVYVSIFHQTQVIVTITLFSLYIIFSSFFLFLSFIFFLFFFSFFPFLFSLFYFAFLFFTFLFLFNFVLMINGAVQSYFISKIAPEILIAYTVNSALTHGEFFFICTYNVHIRYSQPSINYKRSSVDMLSFTFVL